MACQSVCLPVCPSVRDACLFFLTMMNPSPDRLPVPGPVPVPVPNLANMDEKDKRLARSHARPPPARLLDPTLPVRCVASHTPPLKTPGPVNQLTSGSSPLSRLELNPAAPALSLSLTTIPSNVLRTAPHRPGPGHWPLAAARSSVPVLVLASLLLTTTTTAHNTTTAAGPRVGK